MAARKGNRRKGRVAFLVNGKVTWGNDGFSYVPPGGKAKAKPKGKTR